MSFWDCSICQEQYKKKSLQCRIVADFAMLLEKQDTIHKKEHLI